MHILEDHSPYYIKFNDPNTSTIVDLCKKSISPTNRMLRQLPNYRHEVLPENIGKNILELVPKSAELRLRSNRVSLFISEAGFYYGAHKDGLGMRFGVNYPIEILDNDCITSWYSDNIADNCLIDNLNGRSREVVGFEKKNHIPIYTATMKIGAPVLFNTDIYHDWDNTKSTNRRMVLTLRSSSTEITFDMAREILFG
jgi:hypothetical protein